MPIFCTKLTAGLIKLKLEEHGLTKQTKITTVEAGQTVRAGKFEVEFIHVNHSIADSAAFAIRTKMGTIVHTGDFKIDSTPLTARSSTWAASANWANRVSWRCCAIPPTWSAPASLSLSARWGGPWTSFSPAATSVSS